MTPTVCPRDSARARGLRLACRSLAFALAFGAGASAGACRGVLDIDDLVLAGGQGGASGEGGAGGASGKAGAGGGGEAPRECQRRCAQAVAASQITKYYDPFAACGCEDGVVLGCQLVCNRCDIRGELFGFVDEACISCLGRKARSPDCPPDPSCKGDCGKFRDCIETCG